MNSCLRWALNGYTLEVMRGKASLSKEIEYARTRGINQRTDHGKQ